MRNYKSLSLLLVVAILVSLSLTGCRTKEPVAAKKTYDGIELTYYKVFDDSDTIEPFISSFEAQHPGLQIHYRMFSDFNEYQRVILNEMAEGEGPDIMSMQNTWFMSNYKKLSPMPDSLGGPDGAVKAFEEIFVDTAYRDLVRTDNEGKLSVYGIPMTVDSLALYYNKDHFEDRLASKGAPSATWEGIKEDVEKLKKEDESFDRFEVAGIALGRTDNISRAVDILYLMMLQFGANFYNDEVSETTFAGNHGAPFNFPALEALKLYTSFADDDNKFYTWNEYTGGGEGEEIEAFAAGEVSMIIGYSYTYDLILDEIDKLKNDGSSHIGEDAIRINSIPQLYDPKTSGKKRVSYSSYFAEAVSRNCENPDLAWKFLIHLTTSENLKTYFDETHKVTSRRDMIEDQKKDPVYGIFAQQAGFAESFPILDYYIYKDIFEAIIQEANDSKGTNGKLIEAQDRINKLLPKGGLWVPVKEEEENPDE